MIASHPATSHRRHLKGGPRHIAASRHTTPPSLGLHPPCHGPARPLSPPSDGAALWQEEHAAEEEEGKIVGGDLRLFEYEQRNLLRVVRVHLT
jgi:hypothetical protein